MSKNIEINTIQLNGHTYTYELIHSSRKSIGIQIEPGGQITVRSPYFVPMFQIDALLREKADWIQKHYEKQVTLEPKNRLSKSSASDSKEQRLLAKHVITERVDFYCGILDCDYSSITIRDTTSRWGSCSQNGSLNFSWRLILAPDYVLNYVVVHELCHRHYMNHSKDFWKLVGTVMPNYKICRSWLKIHGNELFQK